MNPAPRPGLRVAVLTPRLPPTGTPGGIATAHFNLFRALRGAGWDARAFAFEDAADSEDRFEVRRRAPRRLIEAVKTACRLGLAVASPFRFSYQLGEALGGALAGRRILEALERFRPDVIVSPDKGCPLAFARKPGGARLIWIAHHNPVRFLGLDASPPLSPLDARLAVAVESRELRQADLVLCPSRHVREEFLRTYRFDGPVEIFPNLISGELDDVRPGAPPLRAVLDLAADAPLFYLPAAGTTVKGGRLLAPLLAEIGRRHAQAGVFISGNVEHAHLPAVQSAPANVRVYCPGPLPYLENLGRVSECEVVLSPAMMENFSMALLEATWLGVPVAAFAAGGIPEMIGTATEGCNGETVAVGDVGALCEAGASLLRRQRAGELTRAQVAACTRERFSTARALERLEALIRSLAGPARSPQ
ncbi:MAG TPA: glycosyltransferase family 4 protein [Burkholderiales bacterium]|nr:glycosyltransferase family 4 protein [Burkholderiales bacterium]